MPQHLTILRHNLYGGQEAKVRTEYGATEWFPIGRSVRQECILSPYLFNQYTEHIIGENELDSEEEGVKISGINYQ